MGIKEQEVRKAIAKLSTKMSEPQAIIVLDSLLISFNQLKLSEVKIDLVNIGIIQTVQKLNETTKGNINLIKNIARDSRAFIGFTVLAMGEKR